MKNDSEMMKCKCKMYHTHILFLLLLFWNIGGSVRFKGTGSFCLYDLFWIWIHFMAVLHPPHLILSFCKCWCPKEKSSMYEEMGYNQTGASLRVGHNCPFPKQAFVRGWVKAPIVLRMHSCTLRHCDAERAERDIARGDGRSGGAEGLLLLPHSADVWSPAPLAPGGTPGTH